MEEGIVLNRGDDVVELPAGFRFYPTDEELITSYLTEKVKNRNFTACAVAEVDLNKCEPWDLPGKAKMGEKEWYFFCQRDRKYPTGMRTNRATESGYWKATGKDKEIYRGKTTLVGMKKTLVFYRGRAPKGEKTNWVMHEYRLEGKLNYYSFPKAVKEEWVVCRVFHKKTTTKKPSFLDLAEMDSMEDEFFDLSSPPPLVNHPPKAGPSCFSNGDIAVNDGNFLSPHFTKSVLDSISFTRKFGQHPSTSYLPLQASGSYQEQQFPNGYPANFHPSPIIQPYRFVTAKTEPFDAERGPAFSKAEQFSSNQSVVCLSQETAVTAEISSNPLSTAAFNGSPIESISDLDFLLQQY